MTFCHFQFMQTLKTRAAEQRANNWIGVYSLAARRLLHILLKGIYPPLF